MIVLLSTLLCILCVHTVISLDVNAAAKLRVLSEIAVSRNVNAYTRTQGILKAVEDLEKVSSNLGQNDSIDGSWNLIYSTQVKKEGAGSSPTGEGGLPPIISVFQLLSDQAYKFFFRFAPQLAGSNSSGSKTKNFQVIDTVKGVIKNRVEIRDGIPIDIVVEGTCRVANVPNEVEVCFISTTINGIKIPLPRPVGTLTTVFYDGDMRISRGGQGGVFIVKKIADMDI